MYLKTKTIKKCTTLDAGPETDTLIDDKKKFHDIYFKVALFLSPWPSNALEIALRPRISRRNRIPSQRAALRESDITAQPWG